MRYLKDLLDDYDSLSSSGDERCESPNILRKPLDLTDAFDLDDSPRKYSFDKKAITEGIFKKVSFFDSKSPTANIRKGSEAISELKTDKFQNSKSFSKKNASRKLFSAKSIGQPGGLIRMMKCKTQKTKQAIELPGRKLKTTNFKPEPLEYIILNINRVLSVQKTSRKLQLRLNSFDLEVIGRLVTNIDFQLHMISKYGNYFCQELIGFCSGDQINVIVNKVSPHILQIAKSPVGTHSLQRLIERIYIDDQPDFITAIKDKLVELATHSWGTHVVQKILSCFKAKYLNEAFVLLVSNFDELVFNKYGVCVAKQMVEAISDEDLIKQVVSKFEKRGAEVIGNEFGNYFVQEMLIRWPEQVQNSVEGVVLDSLYDLSIQKYASNVVSMVIDIGSKAFVEKCFGIAFSVEIFSELLRINFALFVLKSLIKRIDSLDKQIEMREFLQEAQGKVGEKETEKVDQLIRLVQKNKF